MDAHDVATWGDDPNDEAFETRWARDIAQMAHNVALYDLLRTLAPRSAVRAPRATRRGSRRVASRGDPSDSDDPEQVDELAGLRAASIRAWAHERRRLAARRVA